MKNIGFLFYASNSFGLGHVYRNISIIQKLKKYYNIVVFTNNDAHLKLLEDQLISYTIINNVQSVKNAIENTHLNLLILDKLDNSKADMLLYKESVAKIIDLDDKGEGAMCADVLINAIIPLPSKASPHTLFGPDFLIFNKATEDMANKNKIINEKVETVLLTFGGSDPKNLSKFVLKNIVERYTDINFILVLGPGYLNPEEILQDCKKIDNVKCYQNTNQMEQFIFTSDLAIVSGGLTLFECMYIGTPSLVINQVSHQFETAELYSGKSCVVNLGLADEITQESLIKSFQSIITNKNIRSKLSKNSKSEISSNGLYKVLDVIVKTIENE